MLLSMNYFSCFFFFYFNGDHRDLHVLTHSFPTRRSSDLELLDEWDWTEHFSPQPETERYLNHVADRFDLRRDIQFSARVAAAVYDDESRSWTIALEDGSRHTARFLVTAVGRSEEHTSELQSLMRISYAVFCLKKKN